MSDDPDEASWVLECTFMNCWLLLYNRSGIIAEGLKNCWYWDHQLSIAHHYYINRRMSKDWERFEAAGIKRETLIEFMQIISKLKKFLVLPLYLKEKDKPINQISITYYSCVIDELKALIDQAYAIIDCVKSMYMNKVEWVESYDVYREEEARRGFVCKLSLYNPYINLI